MTATTLDRLATVAQDNAHQRVRGCEHPIRLVGSTTTINPDTGEVIDRYSSTSEVDGITYVRCGDRRAHRCESCSHEYKGDAWQLLAAGMAGNQDKGIPDTVTEHPALFVTLTAPGFGPVHGLRQKGPCRGRRTHPVCPHGRPAWCNNYHQPDDPRLGEPLCVDCYHYIHHVLWQWWAPELWRRTTITIARYLADALDIPRNQLRHHAKVAYSKVAEFQARGIIHYHAVLRLDGPDGPGSTPPSCIDTEALNAVVSDAVRATSLVCRPRSDSDGYRIAWGAQLDIRPITVDAHRDAKAGPVHPELVASYLAKYLTKSTEEFGLISPIRTLDDLEHFELRAHVRNIILTAHQLSLAGDDHQRLADRYATLGYRGHPITKTRRYSTTFKNLRQARRNYYKRPPGLDPDASIRELPGDYEDPDETGLVILRDWHYDGSGYLTLPAVEQAIRARTQALEHA